jgi:hypothetical protein
LRPIDFGEPGAINLSNVLAEEMVLAFGFLSESIDPLSPSSAVRCFLAPDFLKWDAG